LEELKEQEAKKLKQFAAAPPSMDVLSSSLIVFA